MMLGKNLSVGGLHFGGFIDDKNVAEIIATAIDCGVHAIDTGPFYGNGHSESAIGLALKKLDKKIKIATKVGLVPNVSKKHFGVEIL